MKPQPAALSSLERDIQMQKDAELAALLAGEAPFEPPAAAAMRRSVLRASMESPSSRSTPKSAGTTPKSPSAGQRASGLGPGGSAPFGTQPGPAGSAGTGAAPKKRPAEEQQVKVLIKSFEVPELTVTLPNSATVASLKKAVTDAATTLLGGGLRVRVMMQGRKVADEAATLAQCGIQRGSRPDSLGFMLEPMPPVGQPSPLANGEDPLLVLSQAIGQMSPRVVQMGIPSLGRGRGVMRGRGKGPEMPGAAGHTAAAQGPGMARARSGDGTGAASPSSLPTRMAAAGAMAAIRKQAEDARRPPKDYEHPIPEPVPLMPQSSAIVLHAGSMGAHHPDALALVPLGGTKKSRPGIGGELILPGKRRVRRPFSVNEVEALVSAVEKLGTGRWRDVKLRAFAQAKHRTYVDLKDKWKTLVHTAQIAPHQRRGEPVPQELLDRVTKAHQYWTAMQLRQQAEG